MIHKVVSVFDKKAGHYGPPMHVRAVGEALRGFIAAVNDEKAPFSKFPEDYVLSLLGDFDDVSGVFTSLKDGPQTLLHGNEAVQPE